MEIVVIAIFALIYLLTVLLSATKAVPMSIAALIGALLTAWFGRQYGVFSSFDEMRLLIQSSIPLLSLIIGTMIVVEIAEKSGLFRFGALYAVKLSKGNPGRLFVSICLVSALVSMFLSDPTAMLLMAAATVTIAKLLNYDPIPYFISATIMVNLGGLSTLIGSTSNMAIGVVSGIGFATFINYLAICEFALWMITIAVLYLYFKPRLGKKKELPDYNPWQSIENKKRFYQSIFIITLLVVLFLSLETLPDLQPEGIALGCAVLALFLSGLDPAEIFRGIDWETVFFIAAFVFVVGGLERAGILNALSTSLLEFAGNDVMNTSIAILLLSGLASAIVSNLAIALTFIPIINVSPGLQSPAVWSALILGTNLGGATTPLSGSVVIMAIGALKREGITLSFTEFTKIGLLTSVIQLGFSCLYVIIRFGI